MNIQDFQAMKRSQQKISMITCYDYVMASIIDQTQVDCVLVGDSVGMVVHGYSTTVPVTVDMMALHVAAVVKGAPHKFVVGDLPFLSYRRGLTAAMDAVGRLMQAGAHAVKLEGAQGNLSLIQHIIESGIPVMGHLGFTPQSVNQMGGYKVQGKTRQAGDDILQQALSLQAAGCFALVLEMVPAALAKEVTEALDIPTIGIGAGPDTSGQVLVLHDMLGMNESFNPKFLKQFMQAADLMKKALDQYDQEVKTQCFPQADVHCYVGED